MKDTTTAKLARFADRLGTSVCHEDVGASGCIAGKKAQPPTTNLLSPDPISSKPETSEEKQSLDIVKKTLFDEEDIFSSETSSAGSFFFSCPSLSLDNNEFQQKDEDDTSTSCKRKRSRSVLENEHSDSVVTETSATEPVISMGRPLVVEDRNALRLSAKAMARNILHTFQKAVQWRKRCWIETLARPLVAKEREMKEAGATEEELRDLLNTPIAKVIASLNESEIEVLDATTSFRMIPNIWRRLNSHHHSSKKKKISLHQHHQEEKSYITSHGLIFQTVLNFRSPCGYSEVTVEAPGVIEGIFEHPLVVGDEAKLIGVSVEIDTKILATMIEKSSRIIARASAESIINPNNNINNNEAKSKIRKAATVQTLNNNVKQTPHKMLDFDANNKTVFPVPPTSITPLRRKISRYDSNLFSIVKEKCAASFGEKENNKHAALQMVSSQS